MLEALLIVSIVYACMLMPLRGKTFDALTPGQQQRVGKNFSRYMKTRKGKQTPGMRIDEYLPILQKQALMYLITAIVVLPIYVFAIINIYPGLIAGA